MMMALEIYKDTENGRDAYIRMQKQAVEVMAVGCERMPNRHRVVSHQD